MTMRQRIVLILIELTFALGLIFKVEANKCISNFTTYSRWNEKFDKCEECVEGYIGSQCEVTCPYPGYGKDCQKNCNCEQQNCSHITGCKDGSPTLSPPHTTLQHTWLPIEKATNACPSGYTGTNCTLPCRYPSFGVNCQEECDCKKDYCNYITGCNERETEPECAHKEKRKRREYLLYITITLGVVAVVQFSCYLYLSFFYKPVVMIIN